MGWPEQLLEGVPNARDLGGIRTADGRVIKEGRIIRSGPLDSLNDNDIEILKKIPLAAVVDFRTTWEQQQKKDIILDGVRYVDCPIIEKMGSGITRDTPFNHDDRARIFVYSAKEINSQTNGCELMKKMYISIISTDYAIEHYRLFIKAILENETGAVLYHCTMGKDRVGMATVFILSALGVDEDTILNDYMLTRQRLNDSSTEMFNLCKTMTDDEDILYTIDRMEFAYVDYPITAIEYMKKESGSVVGYMLDKNLITEDEIELLKVKYLQ